MEMSFPIDEISRLQILTSDAFIIQDCTVERVSYQSMIVLYGFDYVFAKLKYIPFYQLWIKGSRV